MVKNEDLDKWITIVKIGAGLEKKILTNPEHIKQEGVSYDDVKNLSDELLKLQEFLEKLKVDYRFQPPNYIARLLHRTVTIHLVDGEKVEGVVDGFNNYEIRIKTDEKDILLHKHAIVQMEGDFSRQGNAKKEGGEAVTHEV